MALLPFPHLAQASSSSRTTSSSSKRSSRRVLKCSLSDSSDLPATWNSVVPRMEAFIRQRPRHARLIVVELAKLLDRIDADQARLRALVAQSEEAAAVKCPASLSLANKLQVLALEQVDVVLALEKVVDRAIEELWGRRRRRRRTDADTAGSEVADG